ncbi:MAG: xanthine dehydrogenase family protein molybdopterin-binding subunit [Candidatus Marinimicrobia bacterium]|nr:xanthine dehydrogenase family protein molybdopterin-binding subunit [Candidatus Neomarinimicrobiota bacterium]
MTDLKMGQISRRDFIKLSSGSTVALLLGFSINRCESRTQIDEFSFEPNIYVRIGSDDTITIVMPRSEMGQKVYTALPMILAEELEADWNKVRVVQGDFNPVFGSQTTGGSASIRTHYNRLREAGATARMMLVLAAATKWGTPPDNCYASEGYVHLKGTRKKLSYGSLAALAENVEIPEQVILKDPKDFKIIGRSIKSLDTAYKVDGSLDFGYDLTLPGMLTAVIKRIPTFDGSVVDYDDSKTMEVPGVEAVVQVSSGVAVVAKDTWSAIQGRKALDVTFDGGPSAHLNSTDIREKMLNALKHSGEVLRNDGNINVAQKKANKSLELLFEVPYLDHAPQEPNNCTAHFYDGLCEIWAPTQNPGASFEAAKSITSFEDSKIILHTLRMGGAFGRRLAADYTVDAVELARHFSDPVKVVRTREEDIQHGTYRPATVHLLKAGIGENNEALYWKHTVSGPQVGWHGTITGGAPDLAYAIPNVNVDVVMSPFPVPTGPFRSVAHTQNGFVNECGIDALARLAGQDPYAYRRELLRDSPRHIGVLDLVAEKSGWGKDLEPGHARGIAVHYSFRSYCAMVAEISQEKSGKFRVHRMTAAIDCGQVINPDGVWAQVEGGIVMGLTAALHGKITLENGRVLQSNFHNYPILRMDEMPVIDIHIIKSEEPPTGVGEPPVPPTPPALINAIAALTGEYITRLPING